MADEENLDQVQNNNEDEEEDDDEEEAIQKIEKLDDYQIPHKYLFRLCLLGDAGVGKTSLITRFCDNSFKENYNNTIGVDFRLVTLKYKNTISKIHIWDTAGQERFRSLALNYINKSHGFIFIYDITDKKTFENVSNWINLALDKNKNSISNFLIGNKIDREDRRQVSQNEGEQLAKEKNLYFLETSAKNNENVQKIFYYFTYKLIQYFNKNKYTEEDKIELTTTKAEELPTIRPGESKCNC
jgi:small GTP-binding protein